MQVSVKSQTHHKFHYLERGLTNWNLHAIMLSLSSEVFYEVFD
jgi:hypothetical protein